MRMAPTFMLEESEVEAMLRSLPGHSMEAVLLQLLPTTKKLARPPISGFFVGAVGLGASGRIFLGVNLEFSGLPLSNSVHAEQFLVTNAAQHGEKELRIVAVSSAPCGHCRQFLQELRDAPHLRILIADANAEIHPLDHFLPHRFGPNDFTAGDFPLLLEPHSNGLSLRCSKASLSENVQPSDDMSDHDTSGEVPAVHYRPDQNSHLSHSRTSNSKFEIKETKVCTHESHFVKGICEEAGSHMHLLIETMEDAALEAANASHCPYSKSPSGVALLTIKGDVYSGSYMESAAFNPSLPPLQAALVAFVARGGGRYTDIVHGVLVEKEGASVQFADSAKLLLRRISPDCTFHVHYTS